MQNNKIEFCAIEGRQVKEPVRAHSTDAGIDIFVPLDMEETFIFPGHDILVHTGLRVSVPHGYAFIIKNKSGVATKKKLIVGACVIDCGYTGELIIHLMNVGTEVTKIYPGDKITQGLLIPVEFPDVCMISENEYMKKHGESERGETGFGSTGSR